MKLSVLKEWISKMSDDDSIEIVIGENQKEPSKVKIVNQDDGSKKICIE